MCDVADKADGPFKRNAIAGGRRSRLTPTGVAMLRLLRLPFFRP